MSVFEGKCIFIIGPESSGSMLIAKICSHVLGVQDYGTWDGAAWSKNDQHKVCHRSLPYGENGLYPDIQKWIRDHQVNYELFFVLTTRDVTISENSRRLRWGKSPDVSRKETQIAKEIMSELMEQDVNYMIWSYETFIFFKEAYLRKLYEFIGVDTDFIPALVDGNASRVRKTSWLGYLSNTILKRLSRG